MTYEQAQKHHIPVPHGWVGRIGFTAFSAWGQRAAFWRLRGSSYDPQGEYVGQTATKAQFMRQAKGVLG